MPRAASLVTPAPAAHYLRSLSPTIVRKLNTRSFVRATRSTARDINRSILLNLVREHQPISRADLARRMRTGRGMITSLVNELLAESAVYEGAALDTPRGRRPRMLYIRTRDRLVAAIDVRFSRTYVMLCDFAGSEIATEVFETIGAPAALIAELATRLRRLLATYGAAGRCEGIGLVVPGMIDQRLGRVLNSPQLGWRNVDVRDALSSATGLPVHVENAPIACALAQLWLGGRGGDVPSDFAYVTVSDGVGVGLVVNGQVVRGHANTAGEFGHIPLAPDGPHCLCGSRGCLEAYTSNLATISRYLGQELSPGSVGMLRHATGLTITDVIARARAGDERARHALGETARYLGIGLSAIVSALNPSQIFVGGEITEVWGSLVPALRAGIRARALTDAAGATPVVPDAAGSGARLRGATALVTAPVFAIPQVA